MVAGFVRVRASVWFGERISLVWWEHTWDPHNEAASTEVSPETGSFSFLGRQARGNPAEGNLAVKHVD